MNVKRVLLSRWWWDGLQRGGLLQHKFKCKYNDQKLNLDKMISIASTHTAADDDAGGELSVTALPPHQQK
jgi:hypothetical protein